jgi:hypothetical protein
MTLIRFFTTLMLRDGEEVPGSLVPMLPQWATVEFQDGRPVTAVWQDSEGCRRICWYGHLATSDLRASQVERYGYEPYWHLTLPAADGGETTVAEYDPDGTLVRRTLWKFDRMGLPAREKVLDPFEQLAARREYECLSDGLVLQLRERVAPDFFEKKWSRVRSRVVPELAAEPFPLGGTIADATVWIIGTIEQNQFQARCRSVHLEGEDWHPSITTLATVPRAAVERIRAGLSVAGPGLAPLIAEGPLVRRRARQGKAYYGIVEPVPPGDTLQTMVSTAPLPLREALAVTLQVAEVVRRTHCSGLRHLNGVRPELVFAHRTDHGIDLTGILHRAPSFLSATHHGEALLLPPIFRADFSAADDVSGLAQLLWYAATGSHPHLIAQNVVWLDSWTHDLHGQRERQPWTGPPSWLPILDQCLFGPAGSRPTIDVFVQTLLALLAEQR